MKKLNIFKKILAVATSALMLAFLPNANTLTASADGPVTYYLMYDDQGNEMSDWWYQLGSEWDENAEHRQIYYMNEQIKNGDIIIVGNAAPEMLNINVRLSNLTIQRDAEGKMAMVNVSGGIDNCYVLKDAQAAITGNVTNAYVYGAALANFNSNVTNLYSYNDNPDGNPTIGVSGTVAYFYSENCNNENAPYGSNFAANTFHLEDGDLTTDGSNYTRDIAGGPAASNTQAPSQPTPKPAASGSSSNSDEYDKVPKTGETFPAIWLSLMAVACLGTSLLLRKSIK